MKFIDYIRQEYGNKLINRYVGMAMIISWGFIMLFPDKHFLVLVGGIFYLIIQYSWIYPMIEKREARNE